MTLAPIPYDSVQSNLSQASRYMARAVAELREQGDEAYAAIVLHQMHSLYRPEYLPAPKDEPVLPGFGSRLRN